MGVLRFEQLQPERASSKMHPSCQMVGKGVLEPSSALQPVPFIFHFYRDSISNCRRPDSGKNAKNNDRVIQSATKISTKSGNPEKTPSFSDIGDYLGWSAPTFS